MSADFPTDDVCHGGAPWALGPNTCPNPPEHDLIVSTSGGWIAKLCGDCLSDLEAFFANQARRNLRRYAPAESVTGEATE